MKISCPHCKTEKELKPKKTTVPVLYVTVYCDCGKEYLILLSNKDKNNGDKSTH